MVNKGGVTMDLMDSIYSAMEETAIKNLREKSPVFATLDRIISILIFMVDKNITPDSCDGQHCSIDLDDAADKFNQIFIEHGLDPQLRITCKKIK